MADYSKLLKGNENIKILIAPDSFKGSMTAKEACDAIESGILNVIGDAQIVKVPMADGGEGTVQSIVDAEGGQIIECKVANPIMRVVSAKYGIINGTTAIIEMAEASGLPLIKDFERDPLFTTTYGTGQLIIDALDRGCRDFIIGIGGSATNDGGAGMLQALGVGFLNKSGFPLSMGGGGLQDLDRIDILSMDPRLSECKFVVACDVDNPLCGPKGASAVFGPQKGATPEMVIILDKNLKNYADIIKRDLSKDVADIPGSGAAGGLGAGFMAFLKAELISGIDIVIKTTGLKEKMLGADLVITGEGKCDSQTLNGKTVLGVAKVAKSLGIPTLVLAGTVGAGIEPLYEYGIIGIESISSDSMPLEYSINNGPKLLKNRAEQICTLLI